METITEHTEVKPNTAELKKQIEAEKQSRASEFAKELDKLKEKFQCELISQRVEQGVGSQINVTVTVVAVAL